MPPTAFNMQCCQQAEATTLLPSPTFGDGENLTDEVQMKRAMDGTLYTYVKTKNGRRHLQWTFRLTRNKALELRAFIQAYYAAKIRVTDHNDRLWVGYFVDNPFEFDTTNRAYPAIAPHDARILAEDVGWVRVRDVTPLDMSDKEAIISNYDPSSDDFKDIAARSNESDSGCMYGTSFLVFERSSGRFLEFFCGSKSTRPIAGDIAVFLPLTEADIERKKANGSDVSKMESHGPLPCTFKVRLAKNKRGHSWHVPEPQECSVPFTNLPATAVIVAEIDKFTHPGASEVETVKDDGKRSCVCWNHAFGDQ